MSKKNLLWSVLFAIALIGFSATETLAQSFKYTYRGVEFKCKNKDGKTYILGYDTDVARVVIPSTVRDKRGVEYHVTTVDLFAEATRYKTNTVAIEKGITEIEEYCFYSFPQLAEIYIPGSVERIGKKAFNKKYIPNFNMPSSIKKEDLMAGLAIYPQAQSIDPMENVDWSVYENENQSYAATEVEKPKNVSIPRGTSDIDTHIPNGKQKRENTFCLIIANEKYSNQDTPDVKYAEQDGKTFNNYCKRTLGIPSTNVKFLRNAKYLDIKKEIEWMKEIAEVFGRDANFLVYYAGHGVADEKGHCKLIPSDVSINEVDNGFSLKELYTELGQLTTNNVLVLVDACFSGNDRENVAATNELQRGIVREVKNEVATGNVVVLTAASGSETALSYEEQAHGLFSYYLMKKLQESEGNVTYGELFDYVKKNVVRKSVVVKSKKQTPTVTVSANLKANWKNLKF